MKVATGSEPASYSWESRNAGSLDAMPYVIGIIRIPAGTFDATVPLCNAVYSNVQLSASATHATASHIPAIANALRIDFFASRANGTWTADSGSERFDAAGTNMSIACYTQTASFPTALTVTGTNTISQVCATHTVFVQGTGVTETACSLDDWAFWNEGLTSDEAALVYASWEGGEGAPTNVSALALHEFDVIGGNRQYERDTMQAGTLNIPLLDPDRRFDPANADGPYYPNVVPMRRIRGTATWDGTDYELWEQYITRWPQERVTPSVVQAPLEAVDGMDLLSSAPVEGSLEIGYTGEQIDSILDLAMWPLERRAIDTGQYVVVAQTLASTAQASIQELADSERGIFFVDQDGFATFHDAIHRATNARSTSSQATFSDFAGGILYQNLEPAYDRDRIVNHWTVSPDSGISGAALQVVTDAGSIAAYGLRALSRQTKLLTNETALEQANMLLAETAWPTLRFERLVVRPTTDAAWTACLDLRVSDLVTVKRGTNASEWTGDVISRECFVEGKHVRATAGGAWDFTFRLSPRTSGNYLGAVVLSDPVSLWRMDVNS
jgi:hypothetical protein